MTGISAFAPELAILVHDLRIKGWVEQPSEDGLSNDFGFLEVVSLLKVERTWVYGVARENGMPRSVNLFIVALCLVGLVTAAPDRVAAQPGPTITDHGSGNQTIEYHDPIDVNGDHDPPGNWGNPGGPDGPRSPSESTGQPGGPATATIVVNGNNFQIHQATMDDLREIIWYDETNSVIARVGMYLAGILTSWGILNGVPNNWGEVIVGLSVPSPGSEDLVLFVQGAQGVERHLRNENLKALALGQFRAHNRRDVTGERLFRLLRDMLHRPQNYRRPNSEFNFGPSSYVPPLPGEELMFRNPPVFPARPCDQDRLRELVLELEALGGATSRLIWETDIYYAASADTPPPFLVFSLRDFHLVNAALIMAPDDYRPNFTNTVPTQYTMQTQYSFGCTPQFWGVLQYSADIVGRPLPYELSWVQPYL